MYEALQRRPEILQMIRVKQRIARGIQVRQDDAEVEQELVDLAARTEGHDAVDGVQREPADYEEENDAREILRGLHLAFLLRA